MTERKMSYLLDASLTDYFEETGDVLTGIGGTFTVSAMARVFPGFGDSGPGSAAPVGIVVSNLPTATPGDEGYSLSGAFNGFANLQWGDGGAGKIIQGGGTAIIGGGAEGATGLLHGVFDAGANTAALWLNGTLVGVNGAADFVASSLDTTVGVQIPGPTPPLDGGVGIAGIAIANRVLTSQEIADHYAACLESDRMFDTGVFDALWDVRSGLPTIDDETTQWLDELAAAPLDRVTTDNDFTMTTASHKPRFQ